MNSREAASKAKHYVADLLSDEQPTDIGLEELEFDDASNEWSVTVGFFRPWSAPRGALTSVADSYRKRAYRVLRIDNTTGEVRSMKRREFAAANALDTY